jgi:hypothetical protein
VNPLDLLRGLGGAVGGSSALDPLTKASTALTTQLRKAGLIPNKGIKPEYGGPNAAYYGPAYASAQALGLGGSAPSLRNYGPGYKEKELAAGAALQNAFAQVLVSLGNKVPQIVLINRNYPVQPN